MPLLQAMSLTNPGRIPLAVLPFALTCCVMVSCGQVERDNPADPRLNDADEKGIELIALLPEGDFDVGSERLADFHYEVSGPGIDPPLVGTMNLVGGSAKALVLEVPDGSDRVFRVDAVDLDKVPTFAAAETLDVADGIPQAVILKLVRLRGSLQVSSNLFQEIASFEVAIAVDGDTLRHLFDDFDDELNQRLDDLPTGGGIPVIMRGRDDEDQILIQETVFQDIREDMLAHVRLDVQVGALEVTALFPQYLPVVTVDRFSDEAAFFFKRSEIPDLPAPGEPVDFDDERFLLGGFGPNGEAIRFYHFDSRSRVPAPVYVILDPNDREIPGQLPIFDLLPGEEGHNDIWCIHHVKVVDRNYVINSLNSFDDVVAGGFDIEPTEALINAVMVPVGSTASLRFDEITPVVAQDGWYRSRIVKYLLFEHPDGIPIQRSGEVGLSQMFGFYENNGNELDGFAIDESGSTRNIAAALPGVGGSYSPLWVVQILRIDFFDQVKNLFEAGDLANDATNKILPDLRINAPIVSVN
mgnify:CR=1 FL=1